MRCLRAGRAGGVAEHSAQVQPDAADRHVRNGAEAARLRAGSDRLKPDHVAALQQLIRDFDLFDHCQEAFGVQVILGFTDAVDKEDRNSLLRGFRSISVSEFLHSHGVPDAPDGVEAEPTSYDHGCEPAGRSEARSAVVRLVKLPKPATPKCKDPTPPPVPEDKPGPPKGLCNMPSSRDWQITSIGAVTSPLKTGISAVGMMFKIDQLRAGKPVATRLIAFKGVGPGASAGLPVTIALPSATTFRTTRFVYFEDFARPGLIRDAGIAIGAGFSAMKGLVAPRTEPLELDLSGWQLGFTIGAEVVTGLWHYPAEGSICLKPG